MEKEIVKKYSNGEITVVWQPAACIHSTICWRSATGLPAVFNPRERPWIKLEGGSTAQIEAQVKQCPSGALSFYYNNEEAEKPEIITDTKIEVMPDGPLLVYGNITIKDKSGEETKKYKVTALCRCGHSENKPYCDGSHIKQSFKG